MSHGTEDFPLWQHKGVGQWCKKYRGHVHYFGSVLSDPDGEKAIAKYNREWPYLKEGKTPPPEDATEDGCSIRQACNHFLDDRNAAVHSGELSPATFRDYFATCKSLTDHFGPHRLLEDLKPEDFREYRTKLAKRYGVLRFGCEVTRVRTIFQHALDNELIDKQVRFGTAFNRPSGKLRQKHQNENEKQLFTREEVLLLIDEADVHMRAMIYLALNCGLGPMDLASLPKSALDLENGWLTFPRVKTQIRRRVPLWPETILAVQESLRRRPIASDKKDDRLAFLTPTGKPWVRFHPKGDKPDVPVNSLSNKFGRMMKRLGIGGQRSFYSLRHALETIGGECCDQVAVDACMGHKTPGMGTNYRHGLSDQRLLAVVNVVRDWLLSEDEP